MLDNDKIDSDTDNNETEVIHTETSESKENTMAATTDKNEITTLNLPVKMIIADPSFNVRTSGDESFAKDQTHSANTIAKLAQDIKRNGQLTPLLVRKTKKGYELVAGFRRLEALKLLKQENVRVQVEDMTDEQAYIVNLAENIARKDITSYEKATRLIELKKKFSWEDEKIGAKLGLGKKYVQNLLRMRTQLTSKIIDAWREGNGVCTTDNLAKWAGMEPDEQNAHFTLALGGKEGSGEKNEDGTKREDKPRSRKYSVNLAALVAVEKRLTDPKNEPELKSALIGMREALKFAIGQTDELKGVFKLEPKTKKGDKAEDGTTDEDGTEDEASA